MKGEEPMVNENGQGHAPTTGIGDGKFLITNDDAGAVFVLESKGCLPLQAHPSNSSLIVSSYLDVLSRRSVNNVIKPTSLSSLIGEQYLLFAEICRVR